MAIRILSGIIVPNADKKSGGQVVVEFHPHRVAAGLDGAGSELLTVGPNSDFIEGKPICKEVSLRKIKFSDQDHSRPSEAVNQDLKSFDLGDEFNGNRSLTINWAARGIGAEIHEISYMVIGEV